MVTSPALFSSVSRRTSIHQRFLYVHVGRLVDPVNPVGIEDLPVGPPIFEGRFLFVAFWKIILRTIDGDTACFIPEIFLGDVAAVVFGMPLHVYFAALASHDEMRTDLLVLDKYFKILFSLEVFAVDSAPTRMRDEHFVVHAREERRLGFAVYLVEKDAELFLFVRVRLDTVLMI